MIKKINILKSDASTSEIIKKINELIEEIEMLNNKELKKIKNSLEKIQK